MYSESYYAALDIVDNFIKSQSKSLSIYPDITDREINEFRKNISGMTDERFRDDFTVILSRLIIKYPEPMALSINFIIRELKIRGVEVSVSDVLDSYYFIELEDIPKIKAALSIWNVERLPAFYWLINTRWLRSMGILSRLVFNRFVLAYRTKKSEQQPFEEEEQEFDDESLREYENIITEETDVQSNRQLQDILTETEYQFLIIVSDLSELFKQDTDEANKKREQLITEGEVIISKLRPSKTFDAGASVILRTIYNKVKERMPELVESLRLLQKVKTISISRETGRVELKSKHRRKHIIPTRVGFKIWSRLGKSK